MGSIGVGEIIVMMVAMTVLLSFPISMWAFIDMLTRPGRQWDAIGKNKATWAVLQAFTGPIAAILYFAWVRPKLRAAAADQLRLDDVRPYRSLPR